MNKSKAEQQFRMILHAAGSFLIAAVVAAAAEFANHHSSWQVCLGAGIAAAGASLAGFNATAPKDAQNP